MKAAQWSSIVDEEHPFYAENYGNALARRVTKEIGKRFAAQRIIDDPQDVYFLLPEEISARILGRFPAQDLVAKRKVEHARFRREEPDLFIGDITKLGEVIASSPMLRSTQQPHPRVRPELNADLYGTVSTPGQVEGVVKVLRSEEDFDKFEPGDILVTIETSSVWTPLFNIAAAVVTDVGGILSHSAILGREYGLPVISGCVEGTKKLKTGMRVRVDGDAGAVYILEQSGGWRPKHERRRGRDRHLRGAAAALLSAQRRGGGRLTGHVETGFVDAPRSHTVRVRGTRSTRWAARGGTSHGPRGLPVGAVACPKLWTSPSCSCPAVAGRGGPAVQGEGRPGIVAFTGGFSETGTRGRASARGGAREGVRRQLPHGRAQLSRRILPGGRRHPASRRSLLAEERRGVVHRPKRGFVRGLRPGRSELRLLLQQGGQLRQRLRPQRGRPARIRRQPTRRPTSSACTSRGPATAESSPDVLRGVAARKPVVVWKGGRDAPGRCRGQQPHGSLAGSAEGVVGPAQASRGHPGQQLRGITRHPGGLPFPARAVPTAASAMSARAGATPS